MVHDHYRKVGGKEEMRAGEETVKREELPPLDQCLVTAENLLAVLRAETDALKSFDKERLLALLVEKETLAKGLAKSMRARQAAQRASGKGSKRCQDSHPTGTVCVENEPDRRKRASLQRLLAEIVKRNHHNHVFVQGSLGLWQELLALCLPSTYVFSQTGEAARQAISAKGFALNREI